MTQQRYSEVTPCFALFTSLSKNIFISFPGNSFSIKGLFFTCSMEDTRAHSGGSVQVIRKIIRFTNWTDGKKGSGAGNISKPPNFTVYRERSLQPAETSGRSQKCYMKVKCSLENRGRTEGNRVERSRGESDSKVSGTANH